jgi:hypothetical protein
VTRLTGDARTSKKDFSNKPERGELPVWEVPKPPGDPPNCEKCWQPTTLLTVIQRLGDEPQVSTFPLRGLQRPAMDSREDRWRGQICLARLTRRRRCGWLSAHNPAANGRCRRHSDSGAVRTETSRLGRLLADERRR